MGRRTPRRNAHKCRKKRYIQKYCHEVVRYPDHLLKEGKKIRKTSSQMTSVETRGFREVKRWQDVKGHLNCEFVELKSHRDKTS